MVAHAGRLMTVTCITGRRPEREGRTGPVQPPNRLASTKRGWCRCGRDWWRRSACTWPASSWTALWQAAQRHPDLALIDHDDASPSFEALEQSYATRPQEEVEGYAIRTQEEIEAAFTDLSAELLLILARLLGWEMAQRLTEELDQGIRGR